MSPDEEVRAWWNGLSAEQRGAEGLNVMRDNGEIYSAQDWNVEWDDLLPVGQRMQVHIAYDGKLLIDDYTPIKLLYPPKR